MRDYNESDYQSSTQHRRSLPWVGLSIGVALGLGLILALSFFFNKINQQPAELAKRQEKIVEVKNLPAPPAEEDYEFYEILDEEEAVRIEPSTPSPTASDLVYFVRVRGYSSYDLAQAGGKKFIDWGGEGAVRVEPYTLGGNIAFRLRIGPFSSRSLMNAQRDILYDNDVVNEALVVRQ